MVTGVKGKEAKVATPIQMLKFPCLWTEANIDGPNEQWQPSLAPCVLQEIIPFALPLTPIEWHNHSNPMGEETQLQILLSRQTALISEKSYPSQHQTLRNVLREAVLRT